MLSAVLASSLGPWADCAAAVSAVAVSAGVDRGALEASARQRLIGGGPLLGGRMMVERVSAQTALDLLAPLPVDLTPARRFLAAAPAVPLIVGWDTGRPDPVAKLYLNLSDSAHETRQTVAASIGVPGAPHVLGLNLGQRTVETKVYQQLAALPADAPAALLRWSQAIALAGVVVCHDVLPGGDLLARAVFVAPRGEVRDQLQHLPGFDAATFSAAIPFAWGQVRSVGFAQDGGAWVVYVRPQGQAPALWNLDPAVSVRCPGGELGVYLAPVATAERAYTRSRDYALSYRVRAGQPAAETIAAVMAWALAVVGRHEASGEAGPVVWTEPPRGCDVIAG
jgi:hypothetical protein